MNDTPRTDAEIQRIHDDQIDAEFCRTLERELRATLKERDEAKAQFQKARELKESYFWELGQIELTIDGQGKIDGTGWSIAHKKVLELIAIRDEATAFLDAAITEQIEQARKRKEHYVTDPKGQIDKAFWDGRERALTECLHLIQSHAAQRQEAK